MYSKELYFIHEHFLDFFESDVKIVPVKENSSTFEDSYPDNLEDFLNRLLETGSQYHLIYMRQVLKRKDFQYALEHLHYPVLVCMRTPQGFRPAILDPDKEDLKLSFISPEGVQEPEHIGAEVLMNQLLNAGEIKPGDEENFFLITCINAKSMYADTGAKTEDEAEVKVKLTPLKRLIKILTSERQEIGYIYIYAIFAGILSLSTPLGVQAIIGFISSGQVSTSVVVLISFVILGMLAAGGLQLMQLRLVEHIQQKLFVKTAFDFAYRIPKLRIESVLKFYPPELMNRFFDIVTLQKGLAKLLIDFTAALLQIVLGLLLLSLYHSAFIIFGVILITALYFIIRASAAKGLKTSLYESKYKYLLANWLEEVARALSTFKLAGYSNLPIEKTDYYTSGYLHARKSHFKILVTQYVSFIVFKTVVTGGLLILGCVLMVRQEINIGQFVASEIVVIMVMNAVEKLVTQLDNVYDVLTSSEKIGAVMDLPIETPKGIHMDTLPLKEGFTIDIRNLKYKFPKEPDYILKGIDLRINSGEHICLSGYSASGKTTFINILLGFLTSYDGSVSIDRVSLKDLNKNSLINYVGDNISQEDLFDGTVLENITIGRNGIHLDDVLWAIECVKLEDFINSQPSGLNTRLIGGNGSISESVARKIIIARSIVKKPKLLILEDFLLGMEKEQKLAFLKLLFGKHYGWTVIMVSNDEEIMKLCDRTVIMKEGTILFQGSYALARKNEHFKELV